MKQCLIHTGLTALLALVALPTLACRPFGSYEFAEDRQGGIWFTEGDNNAVSRLAPDGQVTVHPIPSPTAEPSSLALDRQGRLWFAEMGANKIGRLDKQGRIVEFPLENVHPGQVVVDRRGEAWFTQIPEHNPSDHAEHPVLASIGRIDRRNKLQSYPLAEGWPTSIALDDEAWVSILIPGKDNGPPQGKIARLSREGKWTIVANWENSCPRNLTLGARGTLYYSDGCRHVAGVWYADGQRKEWPLPGKASIQQMSLAPDGNLWFTDRQHLGRISPNGEISFVPRPDNSDFTMAILATRSGDVVFSEFYNYNINRLKKSGELVEHLISIEHRQDLRKIGEGESCPMAFAATIAAKSAMDRKRAEEVRTGEFKADGLGSEKLLTQKCLICHDSRRLLLSRRSDWTPSIGRMQTMMELRKVPLLSTGEEQQLIHYLNTHYGLGRE